MSNTAAILWTHVPGSGMELRQLLFAVVLCSLKRARVLTFMLLEWRSTKRHPTQTVRRSGQGFGTPVSTIEKTLGKPWGRVEGRTGQCCLAVGARRPQVVCFAGCCALGLAFPLAGVGQGEM